MDAAFCTAEAAWHIFVDLHDDMFGSLTHCTEMGCVWTEVEVTVFIHRRNHDHCNIVRT